jgi:allantoin racemase
VRVLIVNPNTTAAMTERIAASARAVAAPATEIEAATSALGPASIEGYYDEAFAVPGLIKAICDGEAAGADGAVIACFDDTGLDAARCAVAIPVVGLCEAAIHLAALLAYRFTIVTTLSRSIAPLEVLTARYGVAGRCTVRAAEVPVLALEDSPAATATKVEAAVARALAADRAEAIILGCAGMTDLAAALARKFGVPVIDGVVAAVKLVEALAGLGLRTSKTGAYARPLPKSYSGILAPFAPKVG